ncbi:CD82 antigen-like isoform X1 [Scyliorhinus torazame]|uniref:CD82 antigen-like isoform X1 n=1 Tax=Scyliorhinus torazame TaxID=75743 RepID=UPI003B597CE4
MAILHNVSLSNDCRWDIVAEPFLPHPVLRDILKTWEIQREKKMTSDVKIHILKYFLNLFNGIFLIVGAIISVCGIWILWDENSFISKLLSPDHQDILSISAYCFLVIGITVTIVCLVGCIASIKEVKFLFILYFLFLVLIFILQIATGLAILSQHSKIVTAMDLKTIEIIKHYGNDSFSKDSKFHLLDVIQKEFQCCGYYNSTDWEQNDLILSTKTLPCSCSNYTVADFTFPCTVTESNYIYPEGCRTEIKQWLNNNIFTVLGATAALIIIQVLQFIMAVYLLKYIKKKKRII